MAGSRAALVLALALGPVGLACGSSDPQSSPATTSAANASAPAPAEAAERSPSPSALARRLLEPELLRESLRAGAELGIDWTILAAAAVRERARGPARIATIAYTLQALGAQADPEAALAERGGEPYARAVLALAGRLSERERPTALARLPLAVPSGGPVIAVYGQRYGVLHDGFDIAASTGSPLRAAAAGVVVSTAEHPVFGLHTCVGHRVAGDGPRQLTTCYGNQSRFEVEPGDAVEAGEVIGRAGCTGTCLRPHVHFQVRLGSDQNAPAVDPAPYLPGGVVAEAEGAGRPLEGKR